MNQSNNHSLTANIGKVVALRKKLAWTQETAGKQAGYSERLIRKIERNGAVRPQTLQDVLQCYHEALKVPDWNIDDFVELSNQSGHSVAVDAKDCPNCQMMQEYFEVVFCQRQFERIGDYCCQNIRFKGEGTCRQGIEVIQQRAASLLGAFDPIHFKFERLHSIDDIVYGFWFVKMKHAGYFFDLPASNRWIDLRGNSTAQVADGLFVDVEDQFDVESIVRQIKGVEPRII